jgi:hypothetical protein
MSTISKVIDYVRSRDQGDPVTIAEIAEATGLTISSVSSARSAAIDQLDDIYPCAPGKMMYLPGWKDEHPEEYDAIMDRRKNWPKRKDGPAKTAKTPRATGLPNVIGPVITVQNVVAVNVHPDHVAIQHSDGSWTRFAGKLKLEGN